MENKQTDDETFNEWVDHMSGEKISTRLKAKGIGLPFGMIKVTPKRL